VSVNGARRPVLTRLADLADTPADGTHILKIYQQLHAGSVVWSACSGDTSTATVEARSDMDLVECERLCDASLLCTALEFTFDWATPKCKMWQGTVVAAAVGSALQKLCLLKAAPAFWSLQGSDVMDYPPSLWTQTEGQDDVSDCGCGKGYFDRDGDAVCVEACKAVESGFWSFEGNQTANRAVCENTTSGGAACVYTDTTASETCTDRLAQALSAGMYRGPKPDNAANEPWVRCELYVLAALPGSANAANEFFRGSGMPGAWDARQT
jgi:hypothetical protein